MITRRLAGRRRVLGDRHAEAQADRRGPRPEHRRRPARHFPRRYVKTGELSEVDELERGRAAHGRRRDRRAARSRPTRTAAPARPAYRVEVRCCDRRPALRMSFFAKHRGTSAEWQRRAALAVGTPRACSSARSSAFRGSWQLTNPRWCCSAPTRTTATARRRWSRDASGTAPDLPARPRASTPGTSSGPSPSRSTGGRRRARAAARRGPRASTTCSTSARRCDWIHAPRRLRAGRARRSSRFRFEEALVTQLVLARRRRARCAALGAQARTGGGGGLLDGVRRAAARSS